MVEVLLDGTQSKVLTDILTETPPEIPTDTLAITATEQPIEPATEKPPEKKRRGRPPVDQAGKDFNIALWRLMKDKPFPGGRSALLSVITGLSADAINQRVTTVEYQYQPEEIEDSVHTLSDDERKYMFKYYKDSKDPAVQQFLSSIRTTPRKRPNAEPSARNRPARSFRPGEPSRN